jgi:hypothetical protein
MEEKDTDELLEVSYIENMLDWFVYTILSFLLFIPFFGGIWFKHICISILTGFLLGMINRIIRELTIISKKLDRNKNG